jgi:hypothetical protein
MQKVGLKLYGFSTKLNTEKYGYGGLTRIIPAAEIVQLIRSDPPHPPNSRSILSLQKNGRDAEPRAEQFADLRAVHCADSVQ